MKRFSIYLIILIMTLTAMVYGFVILKYKVFPYKHIAFAYNYIINKTPYKPYGP